MNDSETVFKNSGDTDVSLSAPTKHPRRRPPAFLLAITSGGLLILAYPHADLGWLAFFALAPFLTTFPYSKASSAFGHGLLFGFTYFAGLLYWIAVFAETKIGAFGIAAWFILSAREALWSGIFAVLLNILWRRAGWAGRVIGAACLWTTCEWLRQLGVLGFGWGDLAYSQWRFLPVIQMASITGIWGVTWLIVFVNAAIASRQKKIIVSATLVMGLAIVGGYCRIATERPSRHAVPAAALQANISEDVPYSGMRPSSSAYFYGTLNEFDQMARIARERYGATICVTAETSIPGYPSFDTVLKNMLFDIARRNNVTLIVGARDTAIQTGEDTNSVFVFHPNGTMSGPYNKQQLVPFGEYVPYRKQFPFLNSFHVLDIDMQAGSPNQMPLDAGGGAKAGIAVCYESTYPRFLRQQVLLGATFDVVVTDDTWYGRTAAAKQHLAMSVLRAVETDRSLVRCASTGISAIVAPDGNVLSRADIFTTAVVAAPIEQRTDLTPFVRFGDWFPVLCAAGSIVLLSMKRGESKRVD